jgi:predicted nucleic acid-binding protein
VILVDTSVWIDHLRVANVRLATLLDDGQVCSHPFVIGELACGNLRRRDEFLSLLANLPEVTGVPDDEVMRFIEGHRLMGRGLGWIDVHLLASAAAAPAQLWSTDRRLVGAASRLGVGI